jgi:hypothetical protein
MTPLSQRDERWKDIKLGFGNTTIGGYGCVITCISMIAGLTPDDVNERLKNANGYDTKSVNKNLIIWEKINEVIPNLKFIKRVRAYNNEDVRENLPCLVEVDGSRIGAETHWVLYLGNQQMADPWYGNVKSTNYYAPKGYAVIKKVEENMTDKNDWIVAYLTEWGVDANNEPLAREKLSQIKRNADKYIELEKQISNLNKELEGARAESVTWETRYEALVKSGAKIEEEVAEKNRKIADLETANFKMSQTLQKYKDKVILTQEEYERLLDKDNIYKYEWFTRFLSLFKKGR